MNRIASFSLVSGLILGLSAVILGALAAHALEQRLDADQLDAFETAVRFQMYHALLLLLLGLQKRLSGIGASVYLLLAGTLLFSGSIYLLVLTPLRPGLLTPLGGLLLIIGWGLLLPPALRPRTWQ
jgi:uncharacterized membrane protein YgdD (TMEM256/DUF423 family)